MQICGFNQQMTEGLKGFHNGLVEHGIINRSAKKNQAFEKTIEKELDDMTRFQKETHQIEDKEMRELTEALTKYASAFYKLVQKEGVDKYKQILQFLNKFYFEMDNKYYSELEGQPEDMKKLALYLNEISCKQANYSDGN